MTNSCVVLGDRHQNILEGIRGLLETLFDAVVMVADKQSLVKALEQMKPQIAIVDLSLIGCGQTHSTVELNKLFPNIKIIILSEYNEPDIVDDIMSAGACAFVLKQYAGTDLFEAIESIQNGLTFVSAGIKK